MAKSEPLPPLSDIGPAPPRRRVVAIAAGQHIGVAVAVEVVRLGRADQVLDAGQRVALGVAADAGSRRSRSTVTPAAEAA